MHKLKLMRIVFPLALVLIIFVLIAIGHGMYGNMLLNPNPKIADFGKNTTKMLVQHYNGIASYRIKPDQEIQITEKQKIDLVLSHLKAIPHPRNNIICCGCTGNPWIRLIDNNKELCRISIHHGQMITCSWDNRNYKLQPEVIPGLKALLSDLGIPGYTNSK